MPFTNDQQRAIDSRGCSLIISAAAGSGKTSVLVERVIGLITDEKAPVDVDRLLVVTFTNLAAAEMRSRISEALLKRIVEKPGDTCLRRQLALLPGARIQTVHAFCLDLVRAHYAECGVPADFSIADESRTAELRRQAQDDALEELYVENDPDFAALCDALADEKDNRTLCAVLDRVLDHLSAHADPAATLERFTSPESQDVWQPYLLEEARSLMEHAAQQLRAGVRYMDADDYVKKQYGPTFEALLAFADQAEAALETSWDDAYAVLQAGYPSDRFKPIRGDEHKALADRMKLIRKHFTESVDYISSRLIAFDEAQARFGREENLASLRGLRLAVTRYASRYSALKLSRKLLDFSDLEHYALSLLRGPDGEPTELGLEISGGVDELLVDEYQDTNDIQEAIFRAVSARSRASFFVGDVKQSIYRFRMAQPRIFMDRYMRYEPFEDGAEGKNMRLQLNVNFRSRGEILAACNHVFGAVMSRDFGDIDYTEEEALHQGAPYSGESPVSLEIIDMIGASDDEDSPKRIEAEAILTANHIAELLETAEVCNPFNGTKRPARPEDCAILLSSFTGKSPIFARELDRLGIPVSVGEKTFWQSLEILSMMAFLRVLDNRRQDIPLVGLLRSPFFLFTADELAEIRLADRGASLFDALRRRAETGDEHCKRVLETIDRYAAYVPDSAASQLIGMIYAETSAMAVFGALDGGERRMENLRSFYDMALKCEAGGRRSLFEFIQYAERLMENDKAPETEPAGGVRLMSIHKSKGLEFPFVFLPDLVKTFNLEDTHAQVVMHDEMGFGLRVKIPALRASYRMPMHRAIADASRRELAAEEVRKLYVAMTRARERLFLIMGMKNAFKKLDDLAAEVELGGVSPTWLAGKNNAAEWILASLEQSPCGAVRRTILPYTAVTRRPAAREAVTEEAAPDTEVDPALLALLEKSDAPYAFEALTALPSKLTPAGARRLLEDEGIIDATPEGGVYVDPTPRITALRRGGLTAAERGSAVHRFLQKADWTDCGNEAQVKAQLERMCGDGLMSREEADAVDPQMILSFLRSPWGKKAMSSRAVREYEFAALFSPAELRLGDDTEQEILMNGIIDLLIFEDDGLTIVDFKTDSILPGSEEKAAERHRLQLEIYASAAEKIFCLPVREKIVFFLKTGAGAAL